jgi:hypothetical protein
MVLDNREEVEGIIDPGSQIIAMSEAVCHDIGLAYDPSIKLNMQSANSEVDQSLGLCKGTSICFLTLTLLSYSPLVHMYLSHTFVPSPGTIPTKLTTLVFKVR